MKHFMIDIETLDVRPTALVLSIGAVEFYPQRHNYISRVFYRAIDPFTAQAAGLTISASTVMWWMSQSQEARDALAINPVPIVQALMDLIVFLTPRSTEPQEISVWAHSPSFDLVILENAYRAALLGPAPWTHRQTRCTRTIYALAGVSLSDVAASAGTYHTYHNALDDAIVQAHAVNLAYEKLGLKGDA